jgi:hypothetical protein
MHIRQQMLAHIPSTVAEIQSANECQVIINDNELLMMSSIESHVTEVLEYVVVWMTALDFVQVCLNPDRGHTLLVRRGLDRAGERGRSLNEATLSVSGDFINRHRAEPYRSDTTPTTTSEISMAE